MRPIGMHKRQGFKSFKRQLIQKYIFVPILILFISSSLTSKRYSDLAISVELRLPGITGTKGKPDNRKFEYMGNKNKTNPQINEFEFIKLKKTCLYQNYIELFKKYIC